MIVMPCQNILDKIFSANKLTPFWVCYLDIVINPRLLYISTLGSLSLVADLVHVGSGSYSPVTLIVLNHRLSAVLYIYVIYAMQWFSRLLTYNRKTS